MRNLLLAVILAVSPATACVAAAQQVSADTDAIANAITGPDAAKLIAALREGGELIVVDVLGVVCDFCALAMNKTVGARAEVAATAVDLDKKTLTIVTRPGAGLSDDEITSLVTKAGYKVSKIRRGEAAYAPAAEGAGNG